MIWLRQSTARTVKFGPFLDKTDGVALEIGLVSALDNATTGIRVSKNGGAYADRASATAPTYDAMGDYNVELGTSDTDTLGALKIIFEEAATCLPVWAEFMVVPSNVWDSLFGSDKLQTDVNQWLGTACATPTVAGVPETDLTHLGGVAQSAADLKDFADEGYDPATNKVQGLVLADTCTANSDMRGTDSGATATNLATVDTVVDAIKAVTDVLPDSGALTTIGTDTARLTAVRAAVLTDWINGGRLDLLLDAVKAVTDLLSTNNAYLGPRGPGVFLDDGAANTNTVVGVDGIESNAVSTIAAATTIAGSLGIQRIYLVNDSVITLAQTYEGWEFVGIGQGNQITLGSQDVDNSHFCHLMLTGTQGGTGVLWAKDCSLTALVALECIAQGCYLTGTNTIRASTLIIFDCCLSAVPGNNTPELTFSGGTSNVNFRHYSGGLQLNSMGTGDTVSFESDGQIVVDATCTDGLLTVRGNCDVTDNASGNVTITQSAAVNQANINAEVVDVLRTDTIAQLAQQAPPGAPTLEAAIMYLYQYFRNKREQTASQISMYDDAGSTVIAKSAISDDATTFTKAEFATGP